MNIDWKKLLAVTSVVLAFSLLFYGVQASEIGENVDPEKITQTFRVKNMTCPTCPLTVKSAMKRLKGVISVSVDLESELATVDYDPNIVSAEEIAGASSNVGFPASVTE